MALLYFYYSIYSKNLNFQFSKSSFQWSHLKMEPHSALKNMRSQARNPQQQSLKKYIFWKVQLSLSRRYALLRYGDNSLVASKLIILSVIIYHDINNTQFV